MEHGFLPQYAAPCASDPSVTSPPPRYPRGVETMLAGGAGRLSAAEKGKEKADAYLPGAGARGEPRPWDDARWCDGASVRRRPLGPSAPSEIEELPPSPPRPSRLLAPNAAATAAGTADMAVELERKEMELAVMASRLEQLRRERGGGGASSRFPEALPRRQDAGEVGTLCDRLVATRLQREEMRPLMESLEARKRKNSKVVGTSNWSHITLVITLASGSVLLILFLTQLPPRYRTHILGAINFLWILSSIAICHQMFVESRTAKGFNGHVARFLSVCFLLLVLYISRLVLLLYRFDQ
ncbi:unnamed protein product [Urochloa humidicola]